MLLEAVETHLVRKTQVRTRMELQARKVGHEYGRRLPLM